LRTTRPLPNVALVIAGVLTIVPVVWLGWPEWISVRKYERIETDGGTLAVATIGPCQYSMVTFLLE